MNIITNELTGKTKDLLVTEILFFIVSAKSMNKDLIKLKTNVTAESTELEKRLTPIRSILKSAKRRKLIQLFVASTEFESQTTEIEYLQNKYPHLKKEEEKNVYFIIKL